MLYNKLYGTAILKKKKMYCRFLWKDFVQPWIRYPQPIRLLYVENKLIFDCLFRGCRLRRKKLSYFTKKIIFYVKSFWFRQSIKNFSMILCFMLAQLNCNKIF